MMTTVIHCSAGNIHFFPRTTFIQQKEIPLTKHIVSGCYANLTSDSQRFLLPQSSIRLFQIYRSVSHSRHLSGFRSLADIGTDVAVEEPNPAVPGEDTDKAAEVALTSVETSGSTTTTNTIVTPTPKSNRPRPARKSEMPPVKNEDLTPGASFTGKVRSVQPFGAFVDFGAFTDGLVHVSQMSHGFVKDVGDFVSVGQEVKVRIVETNMESGRISLTMREGDDASKIQQRKESPAGGSSDRPRPSRKNTTTQKPGGGEKYSKFVKGQVLDGTVKNLIRSGAFVSLPDGEEGFIPASEESEGFGNIIGNSSLQVGQEVNVRVLRITRGKVTLTMKKEEDMEGLNRQLNQGVVHVATSPFELAFRKNNDIATFLVEREKAHASETITLPQTPEQTTNNSDTLILNGSSTSIEIFEETSGVESVSSEAASESPQSANSVLETAVVLEDEASSEPLSSLENGNSTQTVTEEDSAGEAGDKILSSGIEASEMKDVKLETPEASS